MTIVELRRELATICALYGVTEEEMRGDRGKNGRWAENRYVQMARGVFIVRACQLGLGRQDLAGFLRMSVRAVGYWRTELLSRGLVGSQSGKVQGERPEHYVRRGGRAA